MAGQKICSVFSKGLSGSPMLRRPHPEARCCQRSESSQLKGRHFIKLFYLKIISDLYNSCKTNIESSSISFT